MTQHAPFEIRVATKSHAERILDTHRDSVAKLCTASYSAEQIRRWLEWNPDEDVALRERETRSSLLPIPFPWESDFSDRSLSTSCDRRGSAA